MHHVIIGNGPAGVIAAEAIRGADPDAVITLIGGEGHPPYARMAIPYLLTGMIDVAGTHLRKQADHFATLRIDLVRDRVESLNSKAKTISLKAGGEVAYDRLLIATGSRAVRPPIDGIDLDGVVNCWTLDDAEKIIERAAPDSRVVLIGAGFIGCIILEALAERGVKLTVIEGENRMVPRMMDAESGGMVAAWCRAEGVDVHLSTKVKTISKTADDTNPLQVQTDDGKSIDCRLVVVAAGVAANVDFLKGSGIDIHDGIVVDSHMRTNLPDIYAAGDVAEGPDLSTGSRGVHAIQPTAADHGRIAGLNMVGLDTEYHGSLNMNVLDTVGLVSASFGVWDGSGDGDTVTVSDPDRFQYLKLAFRGDRLIGGITIGRTDHVGVLRGLIQNKTRLGTWKDKLKENPHRIMDAYVALSQGNNPLTGAR